MANRSTSRRILFLVNGDRHFVTRLALARRLRDAGHEIAVATTMVEHRARMEKEGIRLIELPHRHAARLLALIRLYRQEKPDLVHHIDTEQCMAGATAALFVPETARINMLTDPAPIARSRWARHLFDRPNSRIVVQNWDDFDVLTRHRLVSPPLAAVVPGTGLDVEQFEATPLPSGPPTIAFNSRLLWSKGVGDLVAASRLLKEQGVRARVLLFGPASPDEDEGIAERQLADWHDDGLVQWRGEADDARQIWAQAQIAVLPSYREGLPRQLLEAAACGRPIVATAVAGCRDVVLDGSSGILVPPRDPAALAAALKRLLDDPARAAAMGAAGRRLVEERFRREAALTAMLRLYDALLGTALA